MAFQNLNPNKTLHDKISWGLIRRTSGWQKLLSFLSYEFHYTYITGYLTVQQQNSTKFA